MSLFSFNFNINFVYVLIFWIQEIFIRVTRYFWPEYYTISNDPKVDEYMFILFPIISRLMSGFVILYVYCVLHKKTQTTMDKNDDKRELIYENPITKKKNKYYYLKLLLITCLELSARSCIFIYFWAINADQSDSYLQNTKDVLTFMDIAARYIFSIVILKTKMYKHNLWALYAIIFGFILIVPFDIIDVFYEGKDKNDFRIVIYILVLSFQSIVYPLEDTLIKKFFNQYYILPEKMLFSISIYETIIMSIITLFFYFFSDLKFDLILETKVIIAISIFILSTAVREFLIMKIIYLFSSQSVSFLIISQSVSVTLTDIINFIIKSSEIKTHTTISFPFEIISLILIIFATSVYDEFIIINKWGLNINVKRGIIERAQIDNSSIQSIEHSETFQEFIDDKNT